MDFKVGALIVSVALSGFLFYQNQKRSDMLIEMTKKYQASIQQENSANAAAIMSDEVLMEVIRQSVKTEMAANPTDCSKFKLSGSDAAKMQDLAQKVVGFERKFNKAAAALSSDRGEVIDKVESKAVQLKERIVALCKK